MIKDHKNFVAMFKKMIFVMIKNF